MWTKVLLLFFVFSFLFKSDHSFDQDLGRHIKLGEIITQSWTVPTTNLFSYTNPNFPFVNTHWLFEILAYWLSQTIGIQYLLVLKIIIFIVAVWFILKIIPKENTVLLLPVSFIFLHVLRERTELRPEIFSFLFTALTLFILERYKSSTLKNHKLIFLLPLIQLIWINTHIYFFVGLTLQAIFLIYLLWQYLHLKLKGDKIRFLVISLALSVLVSFLNPNGLSGLLFPLNVTKNYGYTIVENQTMFFLERINFRDPNFLLVKIAMGMIILSILVAFIRRRSDVKNILLCLFGLALASINVRSFPYLVFLSLPATLVNFGPLRFGKPIISLSLVFGCLLLLESFFYLNGDYYKYREDGHTPGLKVLESGKRALDFVLFNNLPGPIYNNFDIGSYIIYRGFPKYQVFVDGRPEAYPAQFFTGVYIPSQSDYKNFQELNKSWNFKTIIFSHTDQTPWGKNFLQSVLKDQDWKLVFIDDFMLVLVKPEVAEQKQLNSINLASLDPNSYPFTNHLSYLRLALFLLGTQNSESGANFIRKTLQIFPEDPIANSIIGQKSTSNFFW